MPTPTITFERFEEVILEGRRWLYVRGYLEHATGTDARVIYLINHRYPGGWLAFLEEQLSDPDGVGDSELRANRRSPGVGS